MKRREFIGFVGGAVVSVLWPRSADKVYRIVFVVPSGQFVELNKGLVTAFLLTRSTRPRITMMRSGS
jgi:hypothetical protein